MDKLNIIIVNDYAHVNGGSGQVALSSAGRLSQLGHSVTLFTAVGPVDKGINKGIDVICTNQPDILNNRNRLKAGIQGVWNFKAAKLMNNLLKSYEKANTIIHIHGWTKALSSSPIRIALKQGFKVVLTLHDYFIACPNGGLYNYQKDEICSVVSMSKQCVFCHCDPRKYLHKVWRVLRFLVQGRIGLIPKEIKDYIYISELSKGILERYLPEESNYYYVKNPVDIRKEQPVDIAKNDVFTFIGRLSKEKGCILFAQAAKELSINATFIGDGELKGEITRIYPKANLIGWVDKRRIREELKKTRALIFPSLSYEGLGLTVLEAMSAGVPVILSDTCAAREVVKYGVCGLWFKRNNKDDLMEKIKIMMDGHITATYGKNAYMNFWKEDYSLENHVNELEKVYKMILERG